MALRAGVRELKNRLTHYLKLVQKGEQVIVTDRDRPVAVLRALEGEVVYGTLDERLAALSREGGFRLAEPAARLGRFKPVAEAGPAGSKIIADDPGIDLSVVYLDSSALIKRYLEEPGSDQVRRIFAGETPLLVSVIAWSECLAALSRRRRGGTLSARGHARAREAFTKEWKSLHEIDLSGEVQANIAELLERFPLRGMDAIHLGSAHWAARRLSTEATFCCADRRLSEAARRTGLTVLDPEHA